MQSQVDPAQVPLPVDKDDDIDMASNDGEIVEAAAETKEEEKEEKGELCSKKRTFDEDELNARIEAAVRAERAKLASSRLPLRPAPGAVPAPPAADALTPAQKARVAELEADLAAAKADQKALRKKRADAKKEVDSAAAALEAAKSALDSADAVFEDASLQFKENENKIRAIIAKLKKPDSF